MRVAPVVGVLTALVLAGCGGSGSLSDTQLRSQATTVCATANQRTARIATPQSPDGALLFLRRGIAVLRPELAQLQTLKAPTQLSQAYSISLTAFSRKLHALERTAAGLASGEDPASAMHALQARLAPLESREDAAWRTLDISACRNR